MNLFYEYATKHHQSISRIALGLVWFYEGLVPKILFVRTDEICLVQASHLVWRTPELTQSRQTESGLSRDDSLVASCAIISRIRPMFEGAD